MGEEPSALWGWSGGLLPARLTLPWLFLTSHPAGGVGDEFAGVFHGQFFLDVPLVDLDRFSADMEARRNFLGAERFANQLKDLKLSVGESFERRVFGLGATAGKKVENLGCNFFRSRGSGRPRPCGWLA